MPYESGITRRTAAARIHHVAVLLPRSRVPAGRRSNPSGGEFGLSSWFSKAAKKVSGVVKGVVASSTPKGIIQTKSVQAVIKASPSAAASLGLDPNASRSQVAQRVFGITRKQYNVGRSIGQAATAVGAAAVVAGGAILAAPLLFGAGSTAGAGTAAGGAAAGTGATAAGAGVTGITGTVSGVTAAASAVGAVVKPIRKALGAKPLTPENYAPSTPQPAPVGISVAPAAPGPSPSSAPASDQSPVTAEAGLLEGLPTWGKVGLGLAAVATIFKMIGGGQSPRKARV